jgi:hypothetical protein
MYVCMYVYVYVCVCVCVCALHGRKIDRWIYVHTYMKQVKFGELHITFQSRRRRKERNILESCQRRVAIECFGDGARALVTDVVSFEAVRKFEGRLRRRRKREKKGNGTAPSK